MCGTTAAAGLVAVTFAGGTMPRLHRLTILCLVTLLLASCSGGSAPTGTGGIRTLAPTAGGTRSTSGATAGATRSSGSATPGFHAAPDLESAVPAQVNGRTLAIESVLGTGFVDRTRHAAGLRCRWYGGRGLRCRDQRQLVTLLAALGRKATDVQISVAYDEARGREVEVQALRIEGATGAQVGEAILTIMRNDAQQKRRSLNAAPGTIGGKQVTVITYANAYPLGLKRYFYASSGILYDVRRADEPTAAAILSGLP
jgi:hypothetical protein